MYGLSAQDLELQARARAFVDELIPLEEEAEQERRAIERGLYATNMPVDVGGQGCTMLQQVLVQEQCGRATNGLAWVMATPPAWLPEVATPEQIERWVKPAARGERHECYAITEEDAGSDVDAITSTAKRDGDDYVI